MKFIARVTDGESGSPVPGALVTVDRGGMMSAADSLGHTPPTDARVGGHVTVNRPGYITAHARLASSFETPDLARLDVLLYPDLPRVVRGRVVDAGNLGGLYRALVFLPGTKVRDETGADGTYLINGFPPGLQTLQAQSDGRVTASADLLARGGDTTEINFTLRDTTNEGRVEGTVSDARTGRPLAAAEVTATGGVRATRTDSLGRFTMARVPAGERDLHAGAPGYETRIIPVRIVKGWTITVDFRLNPKQ